MIPVNSQNLSSVGYNNEEHILIIQFRKGPIYRYYDVPRSVYEELLSSPDVGIYFNQNIKHQYRYDR